LWLIEFAAVGKTEFFHLFSLKNNPQVPASCGLFYLMAGCEYGTSCLFHGHAFENTHGESSETSSQQLLAL
jgi:hypothetical protein